MCTFNMIKQMSLTCMEHKTLGEAGSLQELVISIERDLKSSS